MKNYKFIITGKVQGVFYRVSVKANALKANFKGYVKNLPDKSVEACVSCEENELPTFIEILKKGSKQSEVLNIKQEEIDTLFMTPFEVR